ncbi:unnamed protein product [Lactuca saligna]|uniref:Uncharacterized protein n=1 Tax=Lactuca saligna TaxID=75948 RepID=A0AA35ZFG3_LACSI|nr:unnamed protein product [Lactuca saligna]
MLMPNVETLVSNLFTIWIGILELHANVARFDKDSKPAVVPMKRVKPMENHHQPLHSNNGRPYASTLCVDNVRTSVLKDVSNLAINDRIDIYDGLSKSIKKCKYEFFLVDASAFPSPMKLGNLDDQESDSDPELSLIEKTVVDRLSVNYMKWSDPDEGVLEMVGLENAWAKEEKLDPTLQVLDCLDDLVNVFPIKRRRTLRPQKNTNVISASSMDEYVAPPMISADVGETTKLHERPIHFDPIMADTSNAAVEPSLPVVPPEGSGEVALIQSDVMVVCTIARPFISVPNLHVDVARLSFRQKLFGLGFGSGKTKPNILGAMPTVSTRVEANPSSKENTKFEVIDTLDLDSFIATSNQLVIEVDANTVRPM